MLLRHDYSKTTIVLIFAICVTTSSTTSDSCEMLTKSHYEVRAKADDSALRICSASGSACCSRETEEEILKKTERKLRLQLQDKIIVLRHQLNTHLNSFRSFYYTSINTCHAQLDTLFKQTYGPFYEENSKTLETFFDRLRSFPSPYSDSNATVITNHLFNNLFKIMFSLLNPLHHPTDAQWDCMRDVLPEVQPFGDIPARIGRQLERTLTMWRHFVTALELTHQTLDGFMNTSLSTESVENAARMGDCSLCSGQSAKPCMGLCTNVMKGCLADWSDTDHPWNTLIDNLHRVSQKLRHSHNLVTVLNPLPVQISEAVMMFQERGASITNKLLARCFAIDMTTNNFLGRGKRSVWLRSVVDTNEANSRILSQLIGNFQERLSPMRGWFRSMPNSMCSDDGMAEKDEGKCWNGEAKMPYRKQIAGDGLAAQASNPEFQGARHIPYRGRYVEERVNLGMISFRLSKALNGRNYQNYEIEGSGNLGIDDEDYGEGSGVIPVINIYPEDSSEITPTKSDKSRKSSKFAQKSSTSNVSLVAVCLISLYQILLAAR